MKKTLLLTAISLSFVINSFSQVETMMYVMKNGEVIFSSLVSDVDNMTFDEATPDSTLIVRKSNSFPTDKILLNDIQQLSFSGESLSVKTSNGNEVYVYDDITKLLFGDMNTSGINKLSVQSEFDVLVSVTPTGDVIVESTAAIKSLVLFSVDGKIISMQQCNGMETQCVVSLQDRTAGIYLLRIETEQGTIVKKVVKSLDK